MRRILNVSTGGRRVCGNPRVGVLASEIPTGFPLAALLANDVDAGFPNRLYSVKILTLPSAGVLSVEESSAFSFIGAPDGTYTGTQRVKKYDPGVGVVSTADTTYSFTIGAGGGSGGTSAFSYINVTLQSRDDIPLASLPNLKWALFAQATPDLFAAPVAKGANVSTSAAGAVSIAVPAATVPAGRYWLTLTDSDGTTTQNPPARSVSCPVMVV